MGKTEKASCSHFETHVETFTTDRKGEKGATFVDCDRNGEPCEPGRHSEDCPNGKGRQLRLSLSPEKLRRGRVRRSGGSEELGDVTVTPDGV